MEKNKISFEEWFNQFYIDYDSDFYINKYGATPISKQQVCKYYESYKSAIN